MYVSTLFVTLPSTTADSPLHPCDAMTMRSQPPVRGRCNDGFIGLHVFHLNRLAGHTGLLGRIGHAICSVFFDFSGIFDEGFCCAGPRADPFFGR